jgi:hypothetical protein
MQKNNYQSEAYKADELFNDFLLNEIKSQDDYIRQLMNISYLLIGIYTNVIVNHNEKIKVYSDSFLISVNNASHNFTLQNNITLTNFDKGATAFGGLLFSFILIFPVILWLYALANSIMNSRPSINRQQGAELVVPFLKEKALLRRKTCIELGYLILVGSGWAFFIVYLNILIT